MPTCVLGKAAKLAPLIRLFGPLRDSPFHALILDSLLLYSAVVHFTSFVCCGLSLLPLYYNFYEIDPKHTHSAFKSKIMRSLILLTVSSLASLPIINALGISTSSHCGPDFGLTCKGSKFGNCCSQYSYWSVVLRNTHIFTKYQELTFCSGSTSAYCGTGCKSGYGDCTASSSSSVRSSSTSIRTSSISTRTSSSAIPSSTQKVTTNSRCGKDGNGRTCVGSRWGNCCSQYSYW